MNKIIQKVFLFVLFGLNLLSFLLPWEEQPGLYTYNGISVLTANMILTIIILLLFIGSVTFFEKKPSFFFNSGFASVCMLFAIEFSRFERVGRFSNSCIGPYVGLVITLLILFFYVKIFVNKNAKI